MKCAWNLGLVQNDFAYCIWVNDIRHVLDVCYLLWQYPTVWPETLLHHIVEN